MTSIVHKGRVLAWVLAAFAGGGFLAAQKDDATAGPGYGIVAKPDAAGWTHETAAEGDTYKSARLTVFIAAPATPQRRPDGSFPRGPRKNFGGFNRGPFMTG